MSRKRLVLGALGFALGAHLILVPFRAGLTQMGTDFPNYYTAAVLTIQQQPLREFYDWVWFQRQIHYSGIDRQLGGYVPHTPLTMFPLLPLANLAPQRAKQIWVVLGLLFLIASIFWASKVSRLAILELAVLALCAYTALSNNFRLGQYYLLILFLLILGIWCLLRGRPATGGILLGLIFTLKLYTAPFALYFLARRQWKAFFGFLLAIATLGSIATLVFGWGDIWFFITSVMTRGFDGSVNDPYNPGFSSMTAFLRRTFLPEAELNPQPIWPAPGAFFFLRAVYTLGVLALALVALAKSREDREPQAIGWFIVVLFALSANTASYHFILLFAAIALLLPGQSRWWSAGLIVLYVLVELPVVPWDAKLFPKAWLLLLLFVYAGWTFLRHIGWVALGVTTMTVVAVATAITIQSLRLYRTEVPQTSTHAVVEPGAIYSSSPVLGANGWMYGGIGRDRYVLRRKTPSEIQTLTFDGDAFRPSESRGGTAVVFELVQSRTSRIYSFDFKTGRLQPVVMADGLNPIEPAISPDATKLAFVSGGNLYLVDGDKRTVLTGGFASDPSFFPDGSAIAFAKGRPGRRFIAAVSVNGGGVRSLVERGDCFEPAVSPDGRLLAFACSGTATRQIWIQDLTSARSFRLTNGFCNNDAPAWDADSKSVVFASDCNRGLGLPSLYIAAIRGPNSNDLPVRH